MKFYENNVATQIVEENLFKYNFEEEEFPGKEDMEKLDTAVTFLEYVYFHAQRCGFSEGISDISKMVAFIAEKCKEAEADISRQTIMNWLKKGTPANTASGRENVYRLCFALKMNAIQTGEFFLKAYLERPFNYKDIREAVYFFCLNNELQYSDAQRIIDDIEVAPIHDNLEADNITEQIGKQIGMMDSEEKLKSYLITNRSGFTVYNETATKKIQKLVEECIVLAAKERAVNNPQNKKEDNTKIKNIDDLLSVIYGYAARETEDSKLVHRTTISKSSFPELIKRNWPQREQFQNILERRTASYDVIRRALIMLEFYHFFAHAVVAEKEAEMKRRKTGAAVFAPDVAYGLFDEFTAEINSDLAECGYAQLYWRNPYDWMIGYCAQAIDPLAELRKLIEEYYLTELTDFN